MLISLFDSTGNFTENGKTIAQLMASGSPGTEKALLFRMQYASGSAQVDPIFNALPGELRGKWVAKWTPENHQDFLEAALADSDPKTVLAAARKLQQGTFLGPRLKKRVDALLAKP
jgi:hypothetical protein